MKKYLKLFLFAFIGILPNAFANEFLGNYTQAVEKIIFYKSDKLKVFYGGPVDNDQNGVRWVMSAMFEDEYYKTRAVYEIAFVNCDINNAEDAEVLFVKVSDINIKFQNELSKDYEVFSNLLLGKYKPNKYIVVRSTDFSIVYFPEVVLSEASGFLESDKEKIVDFLHSNFKTRKKFLNFYASHEDHEIDFEDEEEIIYKPFPIKINFHGKPQSFLLTRRIQKNDFWKLYYVIVKEASAVDEENLDEEPALIRIDSGCLSGQVYNDNSCDCLDQLHDSLYQLSQDTNKKSIVIHIPAHDGRGFGSAPKAETEIYKRGGRGRVNHTEPLDTIAAANLLYGANNIDLRTFDGAAKILKKMKIEKVILLTDNIAKVSSLQKNGIQVIRKKTGTQKESCQIHIDSKKNSGTYYND